MSKKILSVLLVLAMVIGMIPFSAYAAAEETVYISVSFDGNYLTAGTGTHKSKPMVYLPVTLKVLKNTIKLANFGLESYIYDADGDRAEDITALHLLIYAHEKIFGTKWKNNVTVSGEAGNLTVQSGLFGFASNTAYNLNGGANATSLDRIVLQGGDFMDVACYTGEDFSTQPLAGFRYFVDEQNQITHRYTAKLNNPLTVSLTPAAENAVFYSRTLLDPNARTVTTDVNGKAAITMDTCGTWYVWSLGDGDSAPAYAEIFVPWENTNNTSAYWPNFRNSSYNMAITNTKTPISAATTVAKWIASKGTSWTDTPSGMIIADNALIFMGQTTITKADLQTGEVLATNKMNGNGGFNIISPTYGDGLIFCPLTGGRIEAFNAKTLESVWVFVDTVGGQNNTPITYHDGYVYTGYWNGEAKDGNFVCVNAATGELVWSKTTLGGHYWAGSVVIGDAVIVGTDDGASGWEGNSHLYALNRLTGEVISDITLTGMGDQRSTIAYSTEKGRVYRDCVWIRIDDTNITFEELCEDEQRYEDSIVTQVVHLEYEKAGDTLLINHIDHEFVFYDEKDYYIRINKADIKGEKYPRLKSFKIDNARIPFDLPCERMVTLGRDRDGAEIQRDEVVPFIVLILKSYFKHTELIDAYFEK